MMKVPAILKDSDHYPPWDWSNINDQIEEAGYISQHPIWLDMTKSYNQSMAVRKQQRFNNKLSNTMAKEKYQRMSREIKADQDSAHDVHNESAQACGYLIRIVQGHQDMKEYTKKHRMETIPEEGETTKYTKSITPSEESIERHVISKLAQYGRLLMSDEILPTFHKRLRHIFSKYESYQYCINKYDRPTIGSLFLLDEEVDRAKKECQQRLQHDTEDLKQFLADCLFDEYVPQKPPARDDKSPAWTAHGAYLHWQSQKGDSKHAGLTELALQCSCSKEELHDTLGDQLDMTIRVCKFDEQDVKLRIVEYFQDRYVGRWQRYVRQQRWGDLARKLHEDRRRLEDFVDGEVVMPREGERMTRKCQIVTNMRLTRARYFKRLDGPEDFELSKTALAMVRKTREAEMKKMQAEQKMVKVERIGKLRESTSSPALKPLFLPSILYRRRITY